MKKIAAVLLSLVLVAATCAGCGTKIDPNDPQKLEIYLYNAGYGYEWCEALLDAFQQEDWVKEKYPDLKVNFEKDELQTRAQELMSASKKVNKYEIVMGSSLEGVLTPDSGVENLTESVYNSVVPGEDVLYKDKLIPSFLTSAAYLDKGAQQNGNDKQYYQINWGSGMTGLVYNEDRLTALGFTVPNTTDELVKIMQDVKTLGGKNPAYTQTTSLVTYGASAYCMYLYYTWWAQYQTVDEYINFYNGIDSSTMSRSPEVFRQQGLLKAMEVLEKIMHRDNGLTWLNPSTGREAYRETQNRLQRGDGIFMANGDWVDNELASFREGVIKVNGRADTVKMMRTPVISDIIERTPSIPDDATLSKVVKAIDEGETSYQGVTAEDFAAIVAARNVVYSIGPGHNAYIPSYASGKEVAVDFLRFMATDKANEIYIRVTNGASLPFKYDLKEKNPDLFEQISPLQQNRLSYFAQMDVNILPSQASFPLVRYGGLSSMKTGSPLTEFTGGTSKGNYDSVAQMVFEREYKYWTDNNNANWRSALSQAGM